VNLYTGLPMLAQQTAQVVDTLMSELRPKLIDAAFSGNFGESKNTRHAETSSPFTTCGCTSVTAN
jgi:hypothetical protein